MPHKPYHRLMLDTAPAAEPLSLSETKGFLRVDTTADDTFITRLIAVAREHAELYLRRSLITQTWKMLFDEYAPTAVELALSPVQSVTSVTLVARDGTETVMSSDSYYLSSANKFLVFDATPISHRVEIKYVTGYGAASDVPEPIKQGMLAHINSMYDNREGSVPMPRATKDFYSPYRLVNL